MNMSLYLRMINGQLLSPDLPVPTGESVDWLRARLTFRNGNLFHFSALAFIRLDLPHARRVVRAV